MKDKLIKLDEAIDNGDMNQINCYLDQLPDTDHLEELKIDSELFARRIICENSVVNSNKKNVRKKYVLFAACLVIAFALGVTAHASGWINVYRFFGDSSTVEIRTNADLSQREQDIIIEESITAYENGEVSNNTVREVVYRNFNDIKEVESEYGIKIIMPSYLPNDLVMEKDITVSDSFDDNHNIYLNYKSETNDSKMMGITIITQNYDESSMVVRVTDTVFEGNYTSTNGEAFTIFNEDGATIVASELGTISYGLIFMGFDEDEMYEVVNSVQLDNYR